MIISEMLEITLAKAYGEIENFDYCDDIPKKLRSQGLLTERHCELIRSCETSKDKNE